jgi:hypothetical protein
MIASLAELKDFLKMTETTDDDKLYELLRDADAEVKARCKRDFERANYTHYYDGTGGSTILLDQYPIVEVTSVHEDKDRNFAADTLLSDYTTRDNTGELILLTGVFGIGAQNIKVVYTAGYVDIPRPIKQAVIKIACANYIESAAQIEVIETSELLYKPDILRREASKTIALFGKMAA